MKGLQSKLNSPASAFALKKELDGANQRLQESDAIQIELMTRNAELQNQQGMPRPPTPFFGSTVAVLLLFISCLENAGLFPSRFWCEIISQFANLLV